MGDPTPAPDPPTPTTPPTPPAPTCFDPYTPATAASLQLGIGNKTIQSAQLITSPVKNYAGQTVFNTNSWQLSANFPTSPDAEDRSIDLPTELSKVAANVGVLRITSPTCKGELVSGRTVRVYAYWALTGAIGAWPTHGISLGATDGTWLEDATAAFVRDDPMDNRQINTLNERVLEHTFDANDPRRAADLVLRVWLLDTYEFASTLYVNRVEWL